MSELLNIYKTLKSKKWVNLSHKIDENSPKFPALPALEKENIFTLKDGFYRWLDEIELKDLLLPLYVIDKSAEVAENNDYVITKQDILDFEAEHGEILPESFVAFRSDWSKRWPSYDEIRNLDDNDVQHTPGWGRDALEFLIKERNVKAVGHETLDTDSGVSAAAEGLIQEYYLLEQDIYQVEVLANLDQVPATGALISVAYPNWTEATGSPVRVVAILPEDE